MNTQNTLNRLNAILSMPESTVRTAITNLIAELEGDLRAEIAKSSGTGSAQKVITKMLKAVVDTRPGLGYAWNDAEDRQCVCDGYRAFRLKNHLPLAPRPDSVGKGIDLDAIFPTAENFAVKFLPISLPSITEVKQYIAIEKAKDKHAEILWHFGPDMPAVNAYYLADLITVLPTADTVWYKDLNSPLYARCGEGDAVLLPMRTSKSDFDAEKIAAAERLHALMRDYRERIYHDPKYSLTLEQFTEMVELSEKIA